MSTFRAYVGYALGLPERLAPLLGLPERLAPLLGLPERLAPLLFLVLLACGFRLQVEVPTVVSAQGLADGPPSPAGIPEPPVAPETIRRDDEGHATIRAVRLTEPMRFDGALDENIYESVRPVTDFIQNIPDHGKPASQATEAWVMFDDTHIYVSARCWDTRPPSNALVHCAAAAALGSFSVEAGTFYPATTCNK